MRKKLWIGVLVFVLLAVPALRLHGERGVYLGDRFFARGQGDVFTCGADSARMEKTDSGASFDICLDGQALSSRLTQEDENIRLTFSDGRMVQGVGDGERLYDAQGMPLGWADSVTVTLNGERAPVNVYALSNWLYRMYAGTLERRGEPWLLLLAALLYGLGLLNLLWPEKMFFLFNRWQYSHAELSDEGRLAQQVGGVVWVAISAGVLYLPLWL